MKAMQTGKAALTLFVAALCLTAGYSQTALSDSSLEALLAQGQEYLTTGRYAEAAARFLSVLAHRSDAAEALFGLGVACGQLGRLDEAREALHRYVQLKPSAADGHSVLGLILLASGRRTEAQAELERALRLEPQNLEAAKALAHLATADDKGARAVALLKPLAESPDFDDEARRLLAAGYAQSGDDRAALRTLAPVLDRQPPPPPEVFVLLVGSALRSGEAAFAEHTCEMGLRLYLDSDEIEQRCLRVVSMSVVNGLESTLRGTAGDVPTLIIMGRLLAEIGDATDEATRERCIKMLQKAVALSPSDSEALYNLGRGLRMLARCDEAVPVLKRALSTNPSEELQTRVWTQIGLAEEPLGHGAAAEDAFSRAFQLNRKLARHLAPSAFDFYNFLMAADQQPRAALVLDEILRWDPAFVPARLKHARTLAEAGRLSEAAAEAEFVVHNTDPADQPLLRAAHILLLQLYTRLGSTVEAKREKDWLRKVRAGG